MQRETGTSQTLGQNDIGHPQLVRIFWHRFGPAAKILVQDYVFPGPIDMSQGPVNGKS
jgi:hypothetical protein